MVMATIKTITIMMKVETLTKTTTNNNKNNTT